MSDPRFREFRRDGFPLCPSCGEDELASEVMLWWNDLTKPRPTLEEILRGGFFCYACRDRIPEVDASQDAMTELARKIRAALAKESDG